MPTVKRPELIARRTDTLDFLQSMLGELRIMAKADRHHFLAHLIEMAYLETGMLITKGASWPSQNKTDTAPRMALHKTGKIKIQ